MKEMIIKEIMKENGISKRKAEELLKISLLYNYNLEEAKNKIKKFHLSEA